MIGLLVLGLLVFICFIVVLRNFVMDRKANQDKIALESSIKSNQNSDDTLADVKEEDEESASTKTQRGDSTFELDAFPGEMTANLEHGKLRDLRKSKKLIESGNDNDIISHVPIKNIDLKKYDGDVVLNESIRIAKGRIPAKLLNLI